MVIILAFILMVFAYSLVAERLERTLLDRAHRLHRGGYAPLSGSTGPG